MDVEPISEFLGARIVLAPEELLQAGVPEQILAHLDAYGVLVFPGLKATDEQMVALSQRLGEMEAAKVTADESEASKMGIYRISKEDKDAAQAEYVSGNDYWHMDGTSFSVPGKATLLKCENPPSVGGETEFANLYAAYEALDEGVKSQISDLTVIHSMAAAMRKVNLSPSSDDLSRWNAVFPPTRQPLVWRQPEGRISMIIGNTAETIAAMNFDEARALLDDLEAWCTQSAFTYRHRWRTGDLVIFNNPGLLHRSLPYPADSGRVLHRATVKGAISTAVKEYL
jgi:alpha-ketoglutarate-dependent taurine dioxygenase